MVYRRKPCVRFALDVRRVVLGDYDLGDALSVMILGWIDHEVTVLAHDVSHNFGQSGSACSRVPSIVIFPLLASWGGDAGISIGRSRTHAIVVEQPCQQPAANAIATYISQHFESYYVRVSARTVSMSSQQFLVRKVVRSAHQVRAYDQVRAYLNVHRNVRVISSSVTRSAAAAPKLKPTPTSTPPPPSFEPAARREQSWLTTKVKSSPLLFSIFLSVARILGYGSPQQFANRRALHLYNTLCAGRADEASAFWREAYALPPTFQSWFTITNLHVWLLTVRLRALPAPHGTQHVQGLIDHFFQDVEERLRAVLQPGVLPPRSSSPNLPSTAEDGLRLSSYPHSSFYTIPTPLAPKNTFPSTKAYQEAVKLQKRSRAPEKLITRQMKILKEQWAGMGMSLDLGLVKGDAEMAAAVWRNLLGARGASGIGLGQEANGSGYRRAVNLVGGLVEDVRKVDVDKEELKDDNSGVHDFAPSENDRYIGYPELMATLVSYIRRESLRLERLDDSVIVGPRRVGREGEGVQNLKWGDIKNAV